MSEYHKKFKVAAVQAVPAFLDLDAGIEKACRLVTETDQNNDKVNRSFGLAYFKSMAHLEDWSKNHPTHLKIFQNFHALVTQFNFEIELRLWHEVAVLDKDNSDFIYINCPNKTGILAFAGV